MPPVDKVHSFSVVRVDLCFPNLEGAPLLTTTSGAGRLQSNHKHVAPPSGDVSAVQQRRSRLLQASARTPPPSASPTSREAVAAWAAGGGEAGSTPPAHDPAQVQQVVRPNLLVCAATPLGARCRRAPRSR